MGKYDALMAYKTPTPQASGKYAALMAYQPSRRVPQGPAADEGLRTAEKVAQGVGLVGGIGAPVAAIAAGAPALPILGGMAGGMAAGAGADWLLEKTGATPALKSGAASLRQNVYQPQMQSVPLNLLANMGIEAIDPRARAASMMEALPMLASTYAAIKGGGFGAKGLPAVRNAVMGAPKVPQGQEAAALLNKGAEVFAPQLSVKPGTKMNIGEMKDAINPALEFLGPKVGAARNAAIKAAGEVPNASAVAQAAITEALLSKGVPQRGGKFVSDLSETPKQSREIARTLLNVTPKVENIRDLDVLAKQARAAAAELSGGIQPNKQAASAYTAVSDAVKKAIESFIPKTEMGNLQDARKSYGSLLNFEKLIRKSSAKGEFSPERFLTQWKTLQPSAKKAMFKPEQIKAIDDLVKQGDPGIIGRSMGKMAEFVQLALAKTVGRGSAIGTLLEKRAAPAVRFNAPNPKIDPAMAQKMGLSGRITLEEAIKLSSGLNL